MVRWPADRALEQMRDAVLEYLVRRQADRILEVLGFEELVYPGQCKRGISPEVALKQPVSITGGKRVQHVAAFMGAVHVAGTEGAALQAAELVEDE